MAKERFNITTSQKYDRQGLYCHRHSRVGVKGFLPFLNFEILHFTILKIFKNSRLSPSNRWTPYFFPLKIKSLDVPVSFLHDLETPWSIVWLKCVCRYPYPRPRVSDRSIRILFLIPAGNSHRGAITNKPKQN